MAFVFLGLVGTVLADAFFPDTVLETLRSEYDERAFQRGQALNRLVSELHDADTRTKLEEVNRFFNQFHHVLDPQVWGEEDYWATPIEFVGLQRGDCEDFVIAKYFVLRTLGVADDHLFLTYVKALKQNIAHMVLTYHPTPGAVPLVLDNYDPIIRPANERTDLAPVYSFNANSLFLSNASAGLGQSLPTDQIKNSKWDALLESVRRSDP